MAGKDITDLLPEGPVEEDTANPYNGWNADLPEAGGVAWIDLYNTRKVTLADGSERLKTFKVSLTSRATTPIEALKQLKEAIDFAEKEYQFRPYQ